MGKHGEAAAGGKAAGGGGLLAPPRSCRAFYSFVVCHQVNLLQTKLISYLATESCMDGHMVRWDWAPNSKEAGLSAPSTSRHLLELP